MVDMTVREHDLLDFDPVRLDGIHDPHEVASGVDHGAPLGGLVPEQGAILLKDGDRDDGGAKRRQDRSSSAVRVSGSTEAEPIGGGNRRGMVEIDRSFNHRSEAEPFEGLAVRSSALMEGAIRAIKERMLSVDIDTIHGLRA
jgi:hypothetical protein